MEPKARYRIEFRPNIDDNYHYHVIKIPSEQPIDKCKTFFYAVFMCQEHFMWETGITRYSDIFVDTVHRGNDSWVDVYDEGEES